MIPATFDLLLLDAHVATMRAGGVPYGAIPDGAVGVKGGTIVWVGRASDVPRDVKAYRTLQCDGRWLTPGLVDCHTHLVYAGNRAGEFEQRQDGVTYADISRQGGGINATVRATRAANAADLAQQSRPRLDALAAEGVTTIEIKSGYGQETATELKQLDVARAIGRQLGVDVRTTLLAAHALPPEFVGRGDDYIDYVCREMIPAVAQAGIADAVDAYCETIAFTPEQTQRVFAAARVHRCPSSCTPTSCRTPAARRWPRPRARSPRTISNSRTRKAWPRWHAQARSPCCCRGRSTCCAKRSCRRLPRSREKRVAMAVATDCNPGTSPTTSLLLMLNMACTLFRMTPQEALAGATVHAARALGLDDRGTLHAGQRADIVAWDIAEPAELAYRIGANPCAGVIRAGRVDGWEA